MNNNYKKNLFEILKSYLASKELGEYIYRKDIIKFMGKKNETTIDNYRNWLTKAGYLKMGFRPGVYTLENEIPGDLTSRALRREAYPHYRNWAEYQHLKNPFHGIENNFNGDALGNHSTIKEWEISHGRGFWGNSTTGYIYDKDIND